MLAYVIRRTCFGALVVLGVLLFLFLLFFGVTSPDDIARRAIGDKAMPQVIEQWKKNHGYDKPRLPRPGHLTDNLLVETDAPYLTPAPHRGAVNAPYLVPLTVRAMAGVLSTDVPSLCAVLSANSERLYGPW